MLTLGSFFVQKDKILGHMGWLAASLALTFCCSFFVLFGFLVFLVLSGEAVSNKEPTRIAHDETRFKDSFGKEGPMERRFVLKFES